MLTIQRPVLPITPPAGMTSRKRRASFCRKMRNLVIAHQRRTELNEILEETDALEGMLHDIETTEAEKAAGAATDEKAAAATDDEATAETGATGTADEAVA